MDTLSLLGHVVVKHTQPCVSVIRCCVTNYPNLATYAIKYYSVTESEVSKNGLAEWFWYRVSNEVALKLLAGTSYLKA